jgi:hypothetical protein
MQRTLSTPTPFRLQAAVRRRLPAGDLWDWLALAWIALATVALAGCSRSEDRPAGRKQAEGGEVVAAWTPFGAGWKGPAPRR